VSPPAHPPAGDSPKVRRDKIRRHLDELAAMLQAHAAPTAPAADPPDESSETVFPVIYTPPPAPFGSCSRTSSLTVSVGTNDGSATHYAVLIDPTDDTTQFSTPAAITFNSGSGMVSVSTGGIPAGRTAVKVRVYGTAGVVAQTQVTVNVY
jgi:hypothetical protein